MQNMELLICSLEYIEEHLCEDLKTDRIAKACHCSKSTLEKLFQCVNSISVHGYVTRRRMMLSAREIAENQEISILQVAVKYGYGSHEAFTRAFKGIWNCGPSEFREMYRSHHQNFIELYPQLRGPLLEGDEYIMERKQVDISQLYDLFVERKDCYFVCCDIVNLLGMNEISRKLGDMAILEAMKRLYDVAGEEDMVFRIGGDEFCLLTNSPDIGYAKQIVDNIRRRNGENFIYEGKEFPLSLYTSVTQFEGNILKYDELFKELHRAIKEDAKKDCQS